MTSAEAPGEQIAIYKHTLECKRLFTECKGIFDLDEQDWLDDRQADFNWWAYGINADKIGRSSLDYRVRERPDIKKVFLGLLEGISLALTESQRIAQESHSNIEAASSPTATPIGDEDGRLSPWSDLTDSDAEGSNGAQPLPSALSEQKFYIQHSLSLLSRLTIEIKRAGSKFRYQRADEALLATSHQYDGLRRHLASIILLGPFVTQIWAHILRENLPTSVAIVIQAWISDTARLSPVQRRVVEAVVLRRNRMVHADKKRKEASGEAEERTQPKKSEEPEPETRDFNLPKGLLPPRETTESGPSFDFSPSVVTGVSTEPATAIPPDFGLPSAAAAAAPRTGASIYTKITRKGMRQDYPGCPVSEGNFTCPFCYFNLPAAYAESKERWRGHVAQDICPYICVFEDCQTPDQLYITSDEWLTHMRKCHSVIRWVCSHCSVSTVSEADYTFDTASEWEGHVRATHGDITSRSPLPVLSKLSERLSLPPVSCPLCSRPEGPLPLDEDDHIAGHLHSLALRSLPWVETGDDGQTIDDRASVLSRDYLAGTDLHSDDDVGEHIIMGSALERNVQELVVRCVELLKNHTSIDGDQLVGSLKHILNSMNSMSEAQKEMLFLYGTRLLLRLLDYSGNLTQDLLREALDDLAPVFGVALPKTRSGVLITQNDIVIAVMGATGSGKSTFISYFCPTTATPGNGLETLTRSVEAHEADIDNQRVILIDTPGFNDTHRSETAVLREVAAWLNRSYHANIKLAGIIYLQRIDVNGLSGAVSRDVRILRRLCGEDRLPCVVLGTTMWSLVPVNTAIQREIELMQNEEFLTGTVRKSSRVFRQDNGLVSALAIVRFILSQQRRVRGGVTLQIQEEMARGARLNDTAAGSEVNAEIDRLLLQHEQELRDLRAEFKQAQNNAHYRKEFLRLQEVVKKKIKEEQEDRERLRVTWEQLEKQRDEELQAERQRAYELELEHRQRILRIEAQLQELEVANDPEAEFMKEELMTDLKTARFERDREQARYRVKAKALETSCIIM